MWNATTGQCVYTQSASTTSTQEDGMSSKQAAIVAACYVPALGAVSVVTYEHHITLYHSEDLTLKKEFSGYNDDILDIKFIGDGDSHVAVATNSELIKLFEVETWSCQTLSGHTDIVMGLDVFDKAALLTSGSKVSLCHSWGRGNFNIRTHIVKGSWTLCVCTSRITQFVFGRWTKAVVK